MSYLLETPHGYYFRMKVPKDLREVIGKRELKKALSTFNLIVAESYAAIYAERAKITFEMMRMERDLKVEDLILGARARRKKPTPKK